MTDLVQWNNCAGCMRKRSLLSEQPSYIYIYIYIYISALTIRGTGVPSSEWVIITNICTPISGFHRASLLLVTFINQPMHTTTTIADVNIYVIQKSKRHVLTLNLLTTTTVAPPSNASIWQMGFNSAFKGLKILQHVSDHIGSIIREWKPVLDWNYV